MARFRPGEEVVCKVKPYEWKHLCGSGILTPPALDQIYTVLDYPVASHPSHVRLCELDRLQAFDDSGFERVMPTAQLHAELDQIFNPVFI